MAELSNTSSAQTPIEPATEKPNPHKETHSSSSPLLRDFTIGLADGLTVPFALTAGLSSLGNTHLVILAGLAELFAGSISMGLGAYLATVTEAKHYRNEEARERKEVMEKPAEEEEEIYEVFATYGVRREEARGVVQGLKRDPEVWVRFMMDFELQLERPAAKGAWLAGLVMAVAYFFGGLLPMIPYFAFHNVTHALFTSIGITAFILVIFGYVKAIITGCQRKDALWSALQTLVIGVVAAGVSYGIVRGVNSSVHVAA
ncbi:Protein ccc1 [Recurvomyces mirabilis]|nr:Protein ccc1 [Recurvomyces mirabilis]